jgi:hypothetical protein
MSVVLDFTQSGSGSTKISAQAADTITLQLAETVESGVLDNAVAAATALYNITGVTIAFSNAGGASQKLAAVQSGSGSTTINAQAGDTITLELAETVESGVLAVIVASLNSAFYPITGVAFAANTTGGAT